MNVIEKGYAAAKQSASPQHILLCVYYADSPRQFVVRPEINMAVV